MPALEQQIARMFCVGFDGPRFTPELRELIDRGVSSIILFTRNFESHSQLRELNAQIKSCVDRPIMICIDQEGGRVQRLRGDGFTTIPSMRELGAHNNINTVKQIGHTLASELRAVNIDMNLAPVLDVDSNPQNPVIGERSFSSDPNIVAQFGCAMIASLQSPPHRIAACGKHFPGHGDTSIDSHLDLPRLSHDLARLEQIELPPFHAAIKQGVAAIMCAHVLFDAIDPHHPATMSHAVIDGLLRQRFNFQGVICSDDLEMKAIINHYGIEAAITQGTHAGIDLFFICKEHDLQHQAIDTLCHAVKSGDISPERIQQSNQRLDSLFTKYVR